MRQKMSCSLGKAGHQRGFLAAWTSGLVLIPLLVAAGPGTAAAQSKCASLQLKVAGKKAFSDLKCYSKAKKKSLPVDSSCLDKSLEKFEAKFAKAEDKGDCVVFGEKDAIKAVTGEFVQGVVIDIPSGADLLNLDEEPEGLKCAFKKLKAAGKAAFAELKCHAKAVKKGEAVDVGCLGKASDKLRVAFMKAETKSECVVYGDTAEIESKVALYVGSVGSIVDGTAGELSPLPICDNPHAVVDSIFECAHFTKDPNEPCSSDQCIRNLLNSATCDFHDNRKGAADCDVELTTGPEIVQELVDAPCFTTDIFGYHLWEVLWRGCKPNECIPNGWWVRCVTDSCSGPVIRSAPRGTKKKVGCS